MWVFAHAQEFCLSCVCYFAVEHQVPEPRVPLNALTLRYRLMKQRDKQTHKGSASKLRVEQLKRKETRKDNMLKKRVTCYTENYKSGKD
jgi:hypothetical protein